jgi:hypothetical protein
MRIPEGCIVSREKLFLTNVLTHVITHVESFVCTFLDR